MKRIGKFLMVSDSVDGNERTFIVYANDNSILGYTAYYNRWKQVVFQPQANTVYSAGCLTDLANFLESLKAPAAATD